MADPVGLRNDSVAEQHGGWTALAARGTEGAARDELVLCVAKALAEAGTGCVPLAHSAVR